MYFLRQCLCFYSKTTTVFGSADFSIFKNTLPISKKLLLPIQKNVVRFKSRKSRNEQNENEDSDESDDEKDTISGKGVDVKTNVVGSMRADLLLKLGLGLARNKVEEAFYESRIRVNSKKIFKKSAHVKIGDELDLIKGYSPQNPAFLIVGRLEILAAKARDNDEAISVKMRRSKALAIENYPDGDPWKQNE